MKLVVVSGPQVLFHLRAALVYAADFEYRSVTCIACRSGLRLLAKTCNHGSREHPASWIGHVRIYRCWPSGQYVKRLLDNESSAITSADHIVDSFPMCQKSFQSTISISLPHAA
ncbi:hypothetical protein [Burkholderia cepacia]|uniref:hypothetical protein n=1 Tax=Burkholderia cepacia TaxID=292 RepID=UPI0012D8B4DB|nr:hypothetical protein [Burkholderia cepacia]